MTINIVGHIGVGGQKGYIIDPKGICPCLPASQWKDPTKIVVEYGDKKDRESRGGTTQSRTVYLTDGLSPTLCSGMDHGNTIPYVVTENESDTNRKHIKSDSFNERKS